jgi:hypothetical protein
MTSSFVSTSDDNSVIRAINLGATKTFRGPSKTEITAINLWRYDTPARSLNAFPGQGRA